jgi:hypothetical protein
VDFLQNMDSGTIFWIVVGLSLCCGVLILVSFGLQIIGNVVGLFSGITDFFFGILGGGPQSWCGCLVLVGGCGMCGVLVWAMYGFLQTCGTPNAVNFCRLFGY